jgi:glycosyltransferase involved in cell wall biosynthesis
VTRAPQFSIVIPTRNRVGMLRRALASVAAQTFQDFETVIVDDGSSDGTAEFLQSAAVGQRKVLRHEQGSGVSAARNRGVAAAGAALVTFLDDDDELRPGALQALHQRLQADSQLDFVWGGRVIHEFDKAGRQIGTRADDWSDVPAQVSGSAFLDFVLKIATNSAFTIRREVFCAVGGFDEQLRVSEDRDLFITLAENSYRGAAVDAGVIDINEHRNSLSRSGVGRVGVDSDLRVIEKHREYLDRAQHAQFLNGYLLALFEGFLEAGNRAAAMRILVQLRQRGALDAGIVRRYLRHAPEFRALKSMIRYDSIRRWRSRRRSVTQP